MAAILALSWGILQVAASAASPATQGTTEPNVVGATWQCTVVKTRAIRHVSGPLLNCSGDMFMPNHVAQEAGELPVGSSQWFQYAGCALACIVCAAMAAGLTLGLTSLDEFELQVLLETLPEDVKPKAAPEVRDAAKAQLITDQRYASTILPLISSTYFGCKSRDGVHAHPLDPTNNHYLLVTLLLLNATANEALPLFFDKLVPAWLACLLSVTVVLIFGEIVPSAIFTGPNQLGLAARLAPIVRCGKFAFMPIVWPISLILDKCLGHDENTGYSKAEIKGLVRALRKKTCELELDEANMIHGVLELHHKTAQDIATPLAEAKSLPNNKILSADVLKQVESWGHSRCFVHRAGAQRDIEGVLLVKKLVTVDPNDRLLPRDAMLKKPVVLAPDENLLSTLNKFQTGGCHLAVISAAPQAVYTAWRDGTPIPEAAQPTMFCSLEDVIEEMLKEEIYDEEDVERGRDWADATSKRQSFNGALPFARTLSEPKPSRGRLAVQLSRQDMGFGGSPGKKSGLSRGLSSHLTILGGTRNSPSKLNESTSGSLERPLL